MPIAIGVGRRVVMLGATIVLVVGAILCALAKNYEWHLAARMVVGLAAGQSEALVPMITQVFTPTFALSRESVAETSLGTLLPPRT